MVVVTQPPNGREIILSSPANRVYDLRFDPRLAEVRVIDADGDGDLDLVLRFNAGTPEESQIVFADMVAATQIGLTPMMQVGEALFGADIVVQKAQALAGEQPTLETAAPSGPEAIGTGATRYDDDLGNLIDLLDAQDVILGVQSTFPVLEPTVAEDDEPGSEDPGGDQTGSEDPAGDQTGPEDPGGDQPGPEDPDGDQTGPEHGRLHDLRSPGRASRARQTSHPGTLGCEPTSGACHCRLPCAPGSCRDTRPHAPPLR